jgi:hypothetical protein
MLLIAKNCLKYPSLVPIQKMSRRMKSENKEFQKLGLSGAKRQIALSKNHITIRSR